MAGFNSLFDPDSATWFGSMYARGEIHGVSAYAYRAALDTADGVVAAVDSAVRDGCPVVGLWCQNDEQPEEIGRVFAAMTRASGWIPQVAVVLERLEGPALGDVVISTDPEIADILVTNDQEAARKARQVIELLGRQGAFGSPENTDQLLDAIPLRLGNGHTLKTSLGRLGGRTVGVVEESGPLDATAAGKGARFVRMCDAFGIPLIAIAGSPEPGGKVHGGAELLHAFAESVVPRITLVTGTANVTMIAETSCSSFNDPHETRQALVEVFSRAPLRRGHHRNIPL
jgi:acetyl-CoA/propionyl-CoA carboxylase carboxyl transferase subunit